LSRKSWISSRARSTLNFERINPYNRLKENVKLTFTPGNPDAPGKPGAPEGPGQPY